MAVNCGGENDDFKFIGDTLHPVHRYKPQNLRKERKNADRSIDVLDTIRVLIEYGESDPMTTDIHGHTAFHLHRGSIEPFKYMLHQEYFHIDLLQSDYSEGFTVAEYHIDRGRPNWSALVGLVLDKGIEERSASYDWPRQIPFPAEYKTILLHETAYCLRYAREDDSLAGSVGLIQ